VDDADTARIRLPEPPPTQRDILDGGGVAVWSAPLAIRTYPPAAPSEHPMYLERRVYQGSSGRVYPLPFIDRIETESEVREWQAVHLENRWIRLVVLPEIGGRIHIGYDKTAGYDFFYRNNVIKPALVGLAGPWVSGGVEFNWPQHHRPATFLPVETEVERAADGSVTVWCSDHDPFARMKGMHGVRLRADSAVIDLVVRLHNRTDDVQTFLWWANAAARAHEDYQSFFPTDVRYVADHARRAITAFPHADRPYYGVDYPARAAVGGPDADRLDYFSNIPVPTSFMVTGTRDEFFGGYDHRARAGFVHWADRGVSPGKKQWTWGSGAFGQAWDAHLTDNDGPYVELMAGVYTDNQPDFAYLAPGETKAFSQYWYPITEIGPAHQANLDAAVSLAVGSDAVRIGVAVTALRPRASVRLEIDGAPDMTHSERVDLAPGRPFVSTWPLPPGTPETSLSLVVDHDGAELLRWRPRSEVAEEPEVATEPPPPSAVASNDELYFTGVHLEQYRHPTRAARPYWLEAVDRDPGDARAQIALSADAHRRGRYREALDRLNAAHARETARNAHPPSGEEAYRRGRTLVRLGRTTEAEGAFTKAAWDRKWAHAAQLELGFLAAGRHDGSGLATVEKAIRTDADDLRALALRVVLLRRRGLLDDAAACLAALRRLDPLDQLARALDHAPLSSDARTLIDVALDLGRAGEITAAIDLLDRAAAVPAGPAGGRAPIAHYLAALLLERAGLSAEAARQRASARAADPIYCFPSGLDEYDALVAARAADRHDALARDLLGMWLFDAGRKPEALVAWREALALGRRTPGLLRNAALAAVDVEHDLAGAEGLLREAVGAARDDRLLFELDQVLGLRGATAAERLALLDRHGAADTLRDDLLVARAELLTAAGRALESIDALSARPLQPWEGGEGRAIAAFERACLAASREALERHEAADALMLARQAIAPPASLGEARLEGQSLASVFAAVGAAAAAAGELDAADSADETALADPAARLSGPVDLNTVAVGVVARRRGLAVLAERCFAAVKSEILRLEQDEVPVDYFATSLPDLLLFDVDPVDARRRTAAALRDVLCSALTDAGDRVHG
jgi:tetratricopeptide (TPR) repeat protein